MKNTAKRGTVRLLIIKTGDKYIGICHEFGFVEEAPTSEEVQEKLLNGAVLMIDTVRKNEQYAPSLNVRPPLKYLLLFYVVPLLAGLSSLFSFFKGDMTIQTRELPNSVAHA